MPNALCRGHGWKWIYGGSTSLHFFGNIKAMTQFFSLELPWAKFAWNTLAASILGLAPFLVLYIVVTPGFASHLSTGGPVSTRFWRQILTNGLPVVFAVNYVGYYTFALTAAKSIQLKDPRLLVLVDMPLRIAVFVFLHVLIYLLSADWFGSFGGSKSTALRVVAPTLQQSARFTNVSGAYLYASLVCALPIYAWAFDQHPQLGKEVSSLPKSVGPWIAALLACFALALTLTGFAQVVVWLQSG